MDLSQIYVHDGRLLRVAEDTCTATLIMEVELPINEWSDGLKPARLVFHDAYAYQEFEGPIVGTPAILAMSVVGNEDRFHRVRIDTNAGYRLICCSNVTIETD